MAYPVVSIEGAVSTWGASGMYATLVSKLTENSISLAVQAPPEDISSITDDYRKVLPALASWSGQMEAYAFSTPRLGNVGLATFSAGGYVAHAYKWSLTIDTPTVHDITPFGEAWRKMRPDRIAWRGTLSCRHDNSTMPVLPALATTTSTAVSLPTLTLKYGLDATANEFSGAASLSQLDVRRGQGGVVEVDYAFEGSSTLSSAGSNPLFATGAIGTFLWDQNGSTTNTLLTVNALSGKDYTGSAFLRSLTLTCEVSKPVTVSASIQGTGALTVPT